MTMALNAGWVDPEDDEEWAKARCEQIASHKQIALPMQVCLLAGVWSQLQATEKQNKKKGTGDVMQGSNMQDSRYLKGLLFEFLCVVDCLIF